MHRRLVSWLLVAPLATVGVLGVHEIAYRVTRTPQGDVHGYLSHLPQVAMLLLVLSLVGASLTERGGRLALWPFPAVTVAAFVAQEHLERVAHTGSFPFLLDKPFFLVGLAGQAVVALAAWLVARLLVRVAGRAAPGRPRVSYGLPELRYAPVSVAPVGAAVAGSLGARSPPPRR